ncbi:MAG: deoxynucleoside kinase [Pleurocapsa sp. SU_196_0]|nr:deoxynucleoside kinase [Pleurocapsa sp. SU_196_0]
MYIVVEGPIGVGKTSLCKILAGELNARLNLEVVEENPFLASFYENPERFAFNVQTFFLLSRFKQLSSLAQESLFESSVVSDYLFDKDFIFASMNLRDAEFELYKDLYAHLKPQLRVPDLTVYVRADTDLLFTRIAKRGREFEKSIDPEYLRSLNTHYDDYFRTYSGKLLTLEGKDFDYVENLFDRSRILEQIWDAVNLRFR